MDPWFPENRAHKLYIKMFEIPTTAIAAGPNPPTIINTSKPVNVIDEKVAIDGRPTEEFA
jgi:hypothetical protein